MINSSETLPRVQSTFTDLGQAIEIDGRAIFGSFGVERTEEGWPKVTASVAFRDQAWRVTSLSLHATDSCTAITREHRVWAASREVEEWLTIGLLKDLATFRVRVVNADGADYSLGHGDLEDFSQRTQARQRRRWPLTPKELAEVAEVYRSAGRAPTKAVAEHFQKSRAQASRYIAAAREEGLL